MDMGPCMGLMGERSAVRLRPKEREENIPVGEGVRAER